ncbi:hypothetical protein BGY98DRAFT_415133 [Russula aff. rugulosa BPL654]|nr:hypothetical protein BGY98DRAFT_415133 [Russula aff. rugulosa BPL654]
MRYIMVARILLILSVFSFVLAAPVPVQKVREAYADAVDVDENVIIVSRKRADPYIDSEWDRSDPEWLTWTPSTKSSSASDASRGSDGVPSPSSSSTGSKLPLNPLSTPGETKMPLDPEGALKSGSTTEIQPASSSGTKSVSWGHTTRLHSQMKKYLFSRRQPKWCRPQWRRPSQTVLPAFLASSASSVSGQGSSV